MQDQEEFQAAVDLFEAGEHVAAFERFLQLAEHGHREAMAAVALSYYEGEGVDADFDKSVAWDTRAAELGNVASMFNLGVSFANNGDLAPAAQWFQKALEAGEGDAALELAKLYLLTEPDPERALGYLKIARESETTSDAAKEEAEELLGELGGADDRAA